MSRQRNNDRSRSRTVRFSDRTAVACPAGTRLAIETAAEIDGMPPAEAASTLREQAR